MNDETPLVLRHPKLMERCRELVAHEPTPIDHETTARWLALAVIMTARSEGLAPIVFDGQTFKLSRRLRRLKLHRLMNSEADPRLN